VRLAQAIANATYRLDEPRGNGVVSELLAKMADMNVHPARFDVLGEAGRRFEKLLAREDYSGGGRQPRQHVELTGRECDRCGVDFYGPLRQVQ